ncbi:glycoside hydrolase family 127 protein [Lacibacter luteus]|uniref:Glycoside hydrolase family 127 protein n=1 Tax=Lacibacter luteus TaxID=2508719 RepID=A0A4Q1CF37_9BACT|nr:beta-L-arabinofuranosidase domain-containing protein [Lacibacter luteus]RXK58441.1 glycoside hydrolase family 127 protein [Lacibacter luteus]
MNFLSNKLIAAIIPASVFSCSVLHAQVKNDYPIQPVVFTQVHVTDQFWAPKINVNADVTIPYTLEQCKRTGRIDNFLRAAGVIPVDTLTAFTFDDTDLYKVIEGASYSLQTKKNASLEKYLDTLINVIAAAQEPDGYLYTFRTMKPAKPHEWVGGKRWEKEEDLSHELYNSGHLYEAAVAHYLATGKRSLLNIAIKNADLLVNTFGWGKEEKFPGHQVVEMGLARLYRVTGKKAYLDLAKFFLDLRGKKGHLNHEYSQAHVPVVDQHTAVGHAVRATYMYTGMADVAALTGDQQYLSAIDDIWRDVISKKIYITGGIGATGNGEAFGAAFDLPNMSAYAETCASIANVYWNSRMFLLHGDAKYIDVLERVMYNGLLSGVSLNGKRFFYPNPLASLGQHQRSEWFSCACCISNMTRFLPSMPGYIYAQNKNDLYVNLFVGSSASIKLPAAKVELTQNTNYPWSGKNEISINPDKKTSFSVYVRIPGWAINEPVPGDLYTNSKKNVKPVTILLNGKAVKYEMKKGYAVITRVWSKNDKLQLELPMDIQKVIANDAVAANKNRFALQMGPIVYCLESPDNNDSAVMNIVVDQNTVVNTTYQPNLLNGVMTLQMKGFATKRQEQSNQLLKTEQEVTAIPYYAWANRGPSEMEVWIPYNESAARPKPASTIASKSKISASVKNKMMYRSLNDQYDPVDSKDPGASYLHWWPKKNTTEWVQYDFDAAYTVSSSKIYWFDDGPWGGCRIPAAWKIYYLDNGQWIPVKNTSAYEIQKDKFCTVNFEPVKTTALKIEVQLPAEYATGIHEWIVQ